MRKQKKKQQKLKLIKQYKKQTRFHKPWEQEPPLPWEQLFKERLDSPGETGELQQEPGKGGPVKPFSAKSPRKPMLLNLAAATDREPVVAMTSQELIDRIRQMIIRSELDYPLHYAHATNTSYGRLFYDSRAPSAWERNHAVITDLSCDLDRAVDEIISFYKSKGIEPGIFQAFRKNESKRLLPLLKEKGFDITYYQLTPLVLKKYPDIPLGAQLKVESVKEISGTVGDAVDETGKDHWKNDSFKQRLKDEEIFLFTAQNAEGQIVSLATLDMSGAISRIDDVFTMPQHRNNGYATQLMAQILAFHRKKSANPVFLFSENGTATHIYQKLGFDKIDFDYPFWSAFIDK